MTATGEMLMNYRIEFQYKAHDEARPFDESASHIEMPLLEQGEFMPIPAPGDSVSLLCEPGKIKAFKVLTRHFSYSSENFCFVNIVVGDIANEEIAAHLKS